MIASITGFSEPRGDQITVETLPFENTLPPNRPRPGAARRKPRRHAISNSRW